MSEKLYSTETFGLSVESNALKGAMLSLKQGKVKVDHLFEIKGDFERLEKTNVNPLYIEQLDQVYSSVKNLLVVSGLRTEEVLIRPLEIKLTKERDVNAVFPFQAEPLLPYPLDKAIVERMLLAKNDQGTLLSIISAKKDHLQTHLEQWGHFNIDPEVVSCEPVALAAFAKYCVQEENPLFIVYFGFDSTSCVIAKEGKVLAAHAFSIGKQDLLEALRKDKKLTEEEACRLLVEINFSELSSEQNGELVEMVQKLRQTILKTYYALSKYAKGVDILSILVIGKGALLSNLALATCQGVNKRTIEPSNPLWNLTTPQLQEYALEIGLGLTSLSPNVDQVNFRQQEFAYPHPWKRYQKPLAIYLGLCCLAAFFLFFLGKAWLGYQEDLVKTHYSHVLEAMNQSHDFIEVEYARKNKISDHQVLSLKEFSQNDLMARFHFLEKELLAMPDSYPLLPNVPRVSDVLAWLSVHAKFSAKSSLENTWQPLLQIDNFSYVLVKRPELTKKQEKYQVKVELEFVSPTPKLAREFHDALITPNDLVDPKGDIKWSATRGKYRTSFFLKDKTFYPSTSSAGG